MSSRSAACGRMRVQMSMVNRVLLLLKMEAKEDMRAANMTASISPRNPAQRERRRGQSEDQRKVLKRNDKTSFFKGMRHCYESLPLGMTDTTSLG